MFDLVLVCDEEKIFEGKIKEINVLTPKGPVSILPQHQPFMSKILGTATYTTTEGTGKSLEIKEGFIYTNGKICFAVVDKND